MWNWSWPLFAAVASVIGAIGGFIGGLLRIGEYWG
jgi:hypothetical protein